MQTTLDRVISTASRNYVRGSETYIEMDRLPLPYRKRCKTLIPAAALSADDGVAEARTRSFPLCARRSE